MSGGVGEGVGGANGQQVTVAIDVMGGDHAPQATVEGILQALIEDPSLQVLATGPERVIAEVVEGLRQSRRRSAVVRILRNRRLSELLLARLKIQPCSEYISMSDKPSEVRRKPNNSLTAALRALSTGAVQAVVYAGNTGAFLEAAVLTVGRLAHVRRPALVTVWDLPRGPVVFLDSGANADCRPQFLAQFAVMGSVYYRTIVGDKIPRVGLLNIGKEHSKGNMLVKQADELIKQLQSKLRNHSGVNPSDGDRDESGALFEYIGFVEPDDVLTSAVDVVVSDGFTGNIMLKASEATGQLMFELIRGVIFGTLVGKATALMLRRRLKKLKSMFDYAAYGGALLLGLNGLCLKTHGKANATAIKNALLFSKQLVLSGINDRISQQLSNNAAF